MKKLYTLLLILFAEICFAQTQNDMNAIEHLRYEVVDKKLNDTYQQILAEYKTDTVFIANLKTSQKIWIKFRDAELKVKFPNRPPGFYGSVQPMCTYQYLTELTEARVKTLQLWIDGVKEGDVCSGTVKTK